MFCANCGARLPDNAKFCMTCGSRTGFEQPRTESGSQQEQAYVPQQERVNVQPEQSYAQSEQSYAQSEQSYAQPEQSYTQQAYTPQQAYTQPQQTYAPQQAYAQQPYAPQGQNYTVASFAAGAAAPVASGASFAAAAATGAAVVKTVSVGKRILTLGAVLAFVVAAFTAYFTYFVDTPDEVIEAFFDAFEDMDMNAMVDCMEPSVASQMEGLLGIGSSILGGVTGFDINLSDLVGIAPAFSDYMDMEGFEPDNFEIVSYSGDKLSSFLDEFGTKWKAAGNAIADEAVVEFDINNIPEYGLVSGVNSSADRIRVRMTVKNYGSSGWRIPADAVVEYVGRAR